MKVFFTSDTHFNHANIIKYAHRPFCGEDDFVGIGDISRRPWKSEEIKHDRALWMDETLVYNWNSIVSPDDIVYHLGDFGFINSEEFAGYLNKLNGHIVLFKGNHDRKNKIKSYLEQGMLYFSGKKVFVQHHPPIIVPECDFAICGHVHDRWKHIFVDNIPVINLSVDVWNFMPVSVNSLMKYYRSIKFRKE